MKDRSDDKLHCKGGIGACDWQSQDEKCKYEPCAAEDHQEEEGWHTKVDTKGGLETSASEDLQSRQYNRLMEKWSRAVSEEEQSQTSSFNYKAPKGSPNLKAIM